MTVSLSLAFVVWSALAPPAAPQPLAAVAVGAQGGLAEGDQTAWLVTAPHGGYVLLDAGTVLSGLRAAYVKGAFPDVDRKLSPDRAAGKVLREQVRAVLISHAHLDHSAGLIVASPDDVPRTVYGLAPTLDALRDHALNWKLWPNLANEGAPPALKKLSYARMEPGAVVELPGTGYRATAFPLAHAGVTSTAFLLESAQSAVLYLGDTGPDNVEKSDRLQLLWERTAPLVRNKALKAIFIEVSFPSSRKDAQLFGHLTPRHLSVELIRLATVVDPKAPDQALKGLPVIITHIKPSLDDGEDPRTVIRRELDTMNTLGVRFVLPQQGDRVPL